MFSRLSVVATTAACLWLGGGAAQAGQVTLRALDHSFAMTGTIQSFDGEIYVLQTTIGPISVAVSKVQCEGADCPVLISDLSAFSITGSRTIARQIMPALIEAYAFGLGGDFSAETLSSTQVKYTILDGKGAVYAEITVNALGSDAAFTALEHREAYIGLSSRRASESERSRFSRAGKGDLTSPAQAHILGLDGLVLEVNPGNPIRSLSFSQIADVFAGNIHNWREVGGRDAPITVYRPDRNSGATRVFESLVMAPAHRLMTDSVNTVDSTAAVSDAVAQDPNGIGLSSMADQGQTTALLLRSACGQIAKASEFTIKTEEYPMSRRLFLYTASGPIPDKATAFLDFLGSDAAQAIVEQAGFVSQAAASASLNDQGRRLAHALIAEQGSDALAQLQDMVSSLLDAERLSLTFRFKRGSDVPDSRAVQDIAQLAALLKAGKFDGKHLMILGFSDNSGLPEQNRRQSQTQAEAIRDALVAALGGTPGNVVLTPIGYGRLSPLSCNDTKDGRNINRRVEIWVR